MLRLTLTKDCDHGQAGDVVELPRGLGKRLRRKGLAVLGPSDAEVEAMRLEAEREAEAARLEAEFNRRLDAEISKVIRAKDAEYRAESEALKAEIGRLQEESAKLEEELAAKASDEEIVFGDPATVEELKGLGWHEARTYVKDLDLNYSNFGELLEAYAQHLEG